jgi:hypothetical protein
MRSLRPAIALAALAWASLSLPACEDETLAPAYTCEPSAEAAGLVAFDPGSVRVFVEAGEDGRVSFALLDVETYLSAMWGEPVAPVPGRPDGAGPSIWLTTAPDARPDGARDRGYTLRREGDAILVWARDPADLVFGTYALLEELGARFFHPQEEIVPAWGQPHLPAVLEVTREPAFDRRGIQMHTLHPIETYEALNEPGERNLAEAQQLIDWVVKTGHNELQWWALGGVDDYRAVVPHLLAIESYAEARGVVIGIKVQTFESSSLQNGFALVGDMDDGEAQIDAKLQEIMAVPWDGVELALGEFLANDPVRLVELLDHATETMAHIAPDTRLSVVNHVGNYPELYVDYQGETTFLYHLPKYCDTRLVNSIHTVFFFDLFRDWGAYGHEDFAFHREFLFEQTEVRTVRYIPESAYWASADIDVPIFMPSYITARQIDVAGIVREQTTRGTRPVEGHILFSSGHEWGYWLTDYLTGRMLWDPEAEVAEHLAHVARGLGDCGADVVAAVDAVRVAQDHSLFDERLAGYLGGEDFADDFGKLAGFVTTPERVPFEQVYGMAEPERQAFEASVVGGLEGYAAASEAPLGTLRSKAISVEPTLGTFSRELADGTEVTRLRALHSAALYRAVIASARGEDPAPHLEKAAAHREAAAVIIERREKEYRYGTARTIEPRPNLTAYDWGYLRQASTLCFWLRQEDQVTGLLDTGLPVGFFLLRSCGD